MNFDASILEEFVRESNAIDNYEKTIFGPQYPFVY